MSNKYNVWFFDVFGLKSIDYQEKKNPKNKMILNLMFKHLIISSRFYELRRNSMYFTKSAAKSTIMMSLDVEFCFL
jgi:membrane protein CcdC involved in cytochrome C biogenesis